MFDGAGIKWTAVAFQEPTETGVVLRSKRFRSVQEIKVAVAKRYRVSIADLEGPCRKREFAKPRQIAMALSYRKLKAFGYSLPMIGRAFGDRDHTTVLHACRKLGTKGAVKTGQRGPTRVMRAQLDRRAS